MALTTLNTSTQFAFRLAVADVLRADPRFSEVQVALFPIDHLKALSGDYLDLYETRMTGDWGQMGNRSQDEVYVMDGRIVVKMPGAGPEQEQAIIERADVLATALQRVIRENYKMESMPVAIRDCALISLETVPIALPGDLIVLVPFQLRVVGVIDYVQPVS